jgi:hypothetical protein
MRIAHHARGNEIGQSRVMRRKLDDGTQSSTTAMAAVGNFACIWPKNVSGVRPAAWPALLPASARASSGTPGSWPAIMTVSAAGGCRRIRPRRLPAVAPYTPGSKETGGSAPSSARTSCHVWRARRAVEHRTRSECSRPGGASVRPPGRRGSPAAPAAGRDPQRRQARPTWHAAAARASARALRSRHELARPGARPGRGRPGRGVLCGVASRAARRRLAMRPRMVRPGRLGGRNGGGTRRNCGAAANGPCLDGGGRQRCDQVTTATFWLLRSTSYRR